MMIYTGQVWVPKDEDRRDAYQRLHGGPLRLVVEQIGGLSPWDEIVLTRHTGPVSLGRKTRTKAFRLLDDYVPEVRA